MNTFILDIGKTNLKCHVLDEQGESLWSVSKRNEVLGSEPYPHFAVEDIWQWVLQAMRTAAKQYAITAINISTHGACAVLLDGEGELVLPVLDYEYQALGAAQDNYGDIRPDFSSSYSPRLPAGLNLGRQLWWLKHCYSEQFTKAKSLLLYPQYWAWKLSGVMSIERTSLGCHTDLWLPVVDDYSALIDILELRQALPPMVDNDKAIGHLLPEVASATGLPVDCQVFPGVHDSNASLANHLPIGLSSQNPEQNPNPSREMAVVSAGTWVITMALGTDPANLIESRDMLANVSVLGKPVCCARFMGGREFEAICELTGASAADPVDASDLEQLIAEQLYALPSFVAGTGPYSTLKGQLYCALDHTTAEPQKISNGKALATLYTALMIDTQLDLLGATGDVIFGSTSTKNPLICQLLAQWRPQQRILLSGDKASTVQGCWALTRSASDQSKTYQQAVSATIAGLFSYRDIWHSLIN